MRELFLKKGIWLSVLIGFVVFVLGIPFAEVKPPMAAGNFLTFYQRALQSKMSVFFIPVLASFPTGAVYVQEKSSGFLKLYSIRISRMEYIKKKLVQSYISGFLPFFWAGLLAFFACFLFSHLCCGRYFGGTFQQFCSVVSELLYGVWTCVCLLLSADYSKRTLSSRTVCHVSGRMDFM